MKKCLSTEQCVRIIAGTLVLVSVGLGYFVNSAWFLLTAFVGLNLLQSAFTGFCLAEKILQKCGVPK